jgi:hypothetical protein
MRNFPATPPALLMLPFQPAFSSSHVSRLFFAGQLVT